MKNKYDNYYYWENLIKKDKGSNPFEGEAITEETVFFRGVVADCGKSDNYDNLIHFPSIKALLGYVNYVFVPMAFYSLLTSNEEIAFPNSTLDEMLGIIEESDDYSDNSLIPRMREFSFQLRMFQTLDDEKLFYELKKFLLVYNERWNDILEKITYFEIFKTPLDVGKYLLEEYESKEEFVMWILEDQMGISEDEWLDICENVYENEFMKKRFTDILNTRIVQF